MAVSSDIPENTNKNQGGLAYLGWVALVLILAAGAYFRFTGLNWDESQHLHPDERFLTMVEASLRPENGLGDYFDTAQSALNPNNVGYSFFVYGTVPIFIVRFIAQALGQTGYDQVFLVGRAASAAVDLLAVILVYLAAQGLFRRRWLSLISAGFYAFAVLPVQLSHFFAVDTFANTFGLAAFCFAVVILNSGVPIRSAEAEIPQKGWDWLIRDWKSVIPYLLFGLFYGLALASKINIAPMAVLLPGAAVVAWTRLSPQTRGRQWPVIVRNLVLAGIVAFLIFRIGQPYAFQGPGFLGIAPNQKWIDNIKGLLVQSNGDGDSPPELQWARRPASFAWTNMVEWGMGLPLGLLATAGLLWMGWRILRGRWREYGLLWLWTVAYFLWQGLSFTRTMRYELPVYPLLMIMAAWLLYELWGSRTRWNGALAGKVSQVPWGKVLSVALAVGTLAATLAWAFAFTRIYTRPITRVDASRWIYQNVPAPINVQIQTGQDVVANLPLSYPGDAMLTPDNGVQLPFTSQEDGAVSAVQFNKLNLSIGTTTPVQLQVVLDSLEGGDHSIAGGTLAFQSNMQDQSAVLAFDHLAMLQKGQRYTLKIELSGENSILILTEGPQLKVSENFHQIALTPKNPLIQSGKPFSASFYSQFSGQLSHLSLPIQVSQTAAPVQVPVSVTLIEGGAVLTANANQIIDITPGMPVPVIQFDPPVDINPGVGYLITIETINSATPIQIQGQLQLDILDRTFVFPLPAPAHLILPDTPFLTPFTTQENGLLTDILLARAAQQAPTAGNVDTLTATITDSQSGQVLAAAKVTGDMFPANDPRGGQVRLTFDPPLTVEQNQTYFLQLATDQGAVALRGSAPANKSSWDDGLPLRVDGLDGYSGLYQGDLNFEMYWNDDAAKLERFTTTLDQADYIFISSNRQWGTTTRVQERYPLTTEYYRDLMGCPADQAIVDCYSTAQVGMYQGKLGFDLVKVSQSEPALGDWQFNSQFAEEAFTVYDHPKVLIFQKRADYSSQNVRNLLGAVDLSKVVQVTPRKAGVPGNLMLPSEKLGQQQEGGTWSDLFDRESILNRMPAVGAVVWYVFIFLLGCLVYPFVRLAMGGLADRGYPLARLVGMILVAFLAWFGSSNGLPFTRAVIWLVLAGLLLVNLVLFLLQRTQIVDEIKSRPKYFLMIEGLFLAFFVLDLLIRLGNPDLWHPAKGGEKPMDFSYLNAVIKSTSFPPYDPWFAGGYINYYYYGFVLVGVLIKALGIIPAAAYNLVLPTLFAMVALAAFSVGWNLLSRNHTEDNEGSTANGNGIERTPFLAGFAAAIGILILGNLGTINMIWEGFQLTVVSREVMEKADFFTRMGWTFQGLANYFRGNPLPYNIGEWYWNPSRAIPGEPITEFPFFTFLYADLHAHMIALPVTVLSIAWGLNILRGRWHWGEVGRGEAWAWLHFGATFVLGGLAIGALRPTNTWDMPVYMVLGALAVLYTALRYSPAPQRILRLIDNIYRFFAAMDGEEATLKSVTASTWVRWILKIGTVALPSILLLVGFSFIFYQPFADWFGQAYNSIEAWTGDHTPMWAYRLHWGVFLFVIASWMVWESVDWMAKTPLSALNKLRPFVAVIGTAVVALFGAVFYLTLNKIQIAWIPLIFGAWALILIFRPGQSDAKRAVLFMTGTALALTLAVELIVLRGDLGRMNTVFKFYMQAWTLFALSAAAALIWLLPAINRWRSNWSNAWQAAAVTLIGCAALFPLLAGQAKIEDRMATNAPHTLDGMAYMAYSHYADQNTDMDLAEDLRAIQWMQENIQGSPVIVEANAPEYRWGTRFTIYTGLPGVVGWNWHQRQQRALTPSEWVTDRVDQIGTFYATDLETFTLDFLRQYKVRYIIVGQLERAYYPEEGLAKFDQWTGKYWKEIYREGKTVIYEVLQ